VCEPVHISLTFRSLQLLLKTVGYTSRLMLRSSPASAATPVRASDTQCGGPHGFACNVGRVALPRPSKLLGNFGKRRRRPCSVTSSAHRAFSNTFS
jgi:hypothetical protein